jgi:hypothetical protein
MPGKAVDIVAGAVDIAAEAVDIAAEAVDIAVEALDIAVEALDTAAERADIVAAGIEDTAPVGIAPADTGPVGAHIVGDIADKGRTAAGRKVPAAVAAGPAAAAAPPCSEPHWPAAVPVLPPVRTALFLWPHSQGIRYRQGALHARIEGKSR